MAYRLGDIIENSSKVVEWNWISDKENNKRQPDLDSDSRWFTGPNFLLLNENQWPKMKVKPDDVAEKIRPSYGHQHLDPPVTINILYFSDW